MFQRILLAVDAEDSGWVATSFTVALARTCGAEVQVVHVNEFVAGGKGMTRLPADDATAVVGSALAELHEAGVPAGGGTYRTVGFDVPAAICDLAAQYKADVIVLGSRRRRLGSALRRSMRERVSRRTQLPIVTAPAPLRVTGRRHVRERLPSTVRLGALRNE